MENLYCKLYVDTDIDKDLLEDHLARALHLRRNNFSLDGDFLNVDVRRNEDYRPSRSDPDGEGFISSRYYLDVEPSENVDRSSYVRAVAGILSLLWSLGAMAVASCDFEDELPSRPSL